MQWVMEYRFVISLGLSAVVGALGLQAWPFPGTSPILGLVHEMRPTLYATLNYAYATVCFSTPFFVINVCSSFLYIFVARMDRPAARKSLPPYPVAANRDELFVVLGEQHHATNGQRAGAPRWLVIPERGLYTGMAIIGAVGTGKTSACMYPYV